MVDSSHSSGKGRAYMVSQENALHQTLSHRKCVFPKHAHSSNTDWDWDCHTKMFEKKANEIVCLIHVIKIYLQRMALFLRMINTWWFDTWTWPWMHVYGSTNHVSCYEFIITIVGINALQYIQSIVTQTWVKQAIMFLLPVNCAVYCVTSIIAHLSSLRSSWLGVSWSVVDHNRTWRLIQMLNALSQVTSRLFACSGEFWHLI